MGHGQASDLALDDKVNRATVGEARDRESGDARDCSLVVEGRGEYAAGLVDQEASFLGRHGSVARKSELGRLAAKHHRQDGDDESTDDEADYSERGRGIA